MRIFLADEDRAFLYLLLKRMYESQTIQTNWARTSKVISNAKRQMKATIRKIKPGKEAIHLRKQERNIILSWLYKLLDASRVRGAKALTIKIERLITALHV